MRSAWARWLGATLAIVLCGASVACSSHSRLDVSLRVTPGAALLDTPVTVEVTGLHAGSIATLTLSTRSAAGVTWRSSARFRADGSGRVTTAQESVGGSYTGVNAMGLFETMGPNGNIHDEQLFSRRTGQGLTETLTVRVGSKDVAHATIVRQVGTQLGVTDRPLRPATDGVYGEMFEPAHITTAGPAALVFGGSEGGLATTTLASTLAAHGIPTLALAYFAEPGLPKVLAQIPLEYFVTALQRLAREPGVDPKRIVISGASRGSEAAMLVAAHYPQLMAGVLDLSPSGTVFGSIPPGLAAWTLGGRDVPHAPLSDFLVADPSDHPESIIPVQRVRATVLTVCGGDDQLWPSCPFSEAIRSRMQAAGLGAHITGLAYRAAGHLVDGLIPYGPANIILAHEGSYTFATGGSAAANAAARADAWPKVIAFIQRRPALKP